MEINYTGHNIEVTAAIKEHTDKKFVRVFNHGANITSISISFSIEKNEQIAKVNIHIPGHEIFAHNSSDDLYKSIDGLVDKVLIQLDKHK